MVETYSLMRFVHLWRRGELNGVVRVGGRYGQTRPGQAFLASGSIQLQIPEVSAWQAGDLVSGLVSASQVQETMTVGPIQYLQVNEIISPQLHHRPSREQSSIYTHQVPSSNKASRLGGIRRHSPEEVQLWSRFLYITRQFFHDRGFLEATTPSLVVNPGMEPELEPFATVWRRGKNAQTCFLPTSPELGLKKLMVQGWTDLFELKTVYRNEEVTPIHEPEFMMLEWYRGFADLHLIEKDLSELIQALSEQFFKIEKSKLTIRKKSVRQVWAEQIHRELTPLTTREELYQWATELNLNPSPHLDWNDLFHLIWVAQIEANLPREPFLLYDYPPSQAALARLNNEGWADRFELYWSGMEIANAFHELTDATEQRRRFVRDQKLRKKYGRTELPIDEEFMSALEYGLPSSGGIALGLDRLFKILWEWFR